VSRQLQLTSWKTELAKRFGQFPAPVVAVLALYSFGVVLAKVSGSAAVVLFLTQYLGGARDALRKRLREFYVDAGDKSGVKQGQKRRDFDVTGAFAPLLRWVLSLWAGQCLPLAIDVTNLGERFHVLCISAVVRGTGIPVAWKVVRGGQKGPWNPHWNTLLTFLRAAVPDTWAVIVLSDRGLESPRLFRDIVALGWHPIMRVKKGGKFRPTGWGQFHYLHALAPRLGTSLHAEGVAYTGEKLRCALLARWEEGYREPWLVLTDLPPEAGAAVWYGLRTWIEQGFKVIKSGGWDWDKTRMEDPERVERLWLVLAVATLWVTALGSAEEVRLEQAEEQRRLGRQLNESVEQARRRQEQERARRQQQEAARQARQARQQRRQAAKATARKKKAVSRRSGSGATAKRRRHRVSVLGLAVLGAAWDRGENPLPQALHPEPWPIADHVVATLDEQDFL
jgi:Transposase DDE domain